MNCVRNCQEADVIIYLLLYHFTIVIALCQLCVDYSGEYE